MNTNKKWHINLLNFTQNSVINLITLLKEKKFHVNQINNWIYKKNLLDINLMTNLTKSLKKKLTNICKIEKLNIRKEYIDIDNTIKWLIETHDKKIIETVAIPNAKNHFTICLSSQIGCILNCKFCATGQLKFERNLKPYEIISQLLIAKNKIAILHAEKKITNIVMMGMGEPLLNVKNILKFTSIITNKECLNISKNKITISTSGITPNIKIIAKNNIPLALSLHFTNNKLRSSLMPINKKYALKDLLNECKKYYKSTNNLTIEYILINNINDSKKDACELAALLKDIKCKICLIPFNEIPETKFKTPNQTKIITFQNYLKKNGFITNIRKKRGFNINAACGQLAGLTKK